MPIIRFHKPTNKIGGTIAEICTKKSRIIIDMGADLPEYDNPNKKQAIPQIEGVTFGASRCDGVFITHYHGDHVGLYSKVLKGIQIYSGKATKEMLLVKEKQLEAAKLIEKGSALLIERFDTFNIGVKKSYGDIKITPFLVDHSAFDAYMFLVEAEGKKILYTGDFRMHGFRGKGVIPMLEKYVGSVDLIITEGTMFSRSNNEPQTEKELSDHLIKVISDHKYVFLLCSSTNIDRIAGASSAVAQAGRILVVDEFQKKMLDVVEKNSNNCELYKFQKIFMYKNKYTDESQKKVDDFMKRKGFCMLVRANGASSEGGNKFIRVINKYKDAVILYSMWSGYKTKDKEVKVFIRKCNGRKVIELHTSGHASIKAIKEVCELVKKKNTVIMPVHTENSQLIHSFISKVEKVIPQMGMDYDI